MSEKKPRKKVPEWKSVPLYDMRTERERMQDEIQSSLTTLETPITGELSEQQLTFVREYALDYNGTQAAIRAGYNPKTAPVQASYLLRNPYVKLGIRRLAEIAESENVAKFSATRERVIQELSRIAFYNPTDFVMWNSTGGPLCDGDEVTFKDSQTLTEAQAACIQQVVQTRSGISIKFHDKKGALEVLARHLGLLNDKLSLNVSGNVTHTLEHTYKVTQGIIEKHPELISQIFGDLPQPELIEEAEIIEEKGDE